MRNFNRAALHWTQPEFQPIFNEASAKIKDALEMHWDDTMVELAIKDFQNLADMFEVLLLNSPAYLLREVAEGCLFLKNLNSLQKEGQDIDQSVYNKMEESIIQGVLQFPPLVEYLATGRKDLPSLAVPLINQIRTLRAVPLLSPSQMFAPDTFIDTGFIGQEDAPSPSALQSIVTDVHHHQFQSSLISWIRKPQAKEPLHTLSSSAMRLARLARDPSLKKLFWVGATVFEAMATDGFVSSRDCNVFLAKMDLLAPWIGEGNISSEQRQDVEKTLQHLLYYVTFEGIDNPGLESIVDLFALEALYHTQDDLDAAHSIMSGKGSDTLSVVAKNLKEEIHQVRDYLDLYVRSPQQGASFVDSVVQSLENAQLTLQVLSMQDAAMLTLAQKEHIVKIAPEMKQQSVISPSLIEEIEEIASDLLMVEEELSSLNQEKDDNTSSSSNIRHSVITQLLINLARARHLVVTFATTRQASDAGGLPSLLQEVASALMLINEISASHSFRKLEELAQDITSSGDQVTSQQDIENFAHALACLEYYIEAVRDEQPDPSRMLAAARDYLLEFGAHMDPEATLTPSTPIPSHIDDVSFKVELKQEANDTTSEAPSANMLSEEPAIPTGSIAPTPQAEETSPPSVTYGTVLFYETEDNLIDQDIREIFIEELSDEIESIQSFIGSNSQPSMDEIKNVRKSFHTIKGSGRMTNALALGEVAYAGELLFTKILEGYRPYNDVVKKFAQKANMMFAQFYLSATTGKPLVWEQDEIISWAQKLSHGQNISWESHLELFEEDKKNFVQPEFESHLEEHIAFVAFSPSQEQQEQEELETEGSNSTLQPTQADTLEAGTFEADALDDVSSSTPYIPSPVEEPATQENWFEMDLDLIAQDISLEEVEQKSQPSEDPSPEMSPEMSHELVFDLGDFSAPAFDAPDQEEEKSPEFRLEDFTSPDLATPQDLDIFSMPQERPEAFEEDLEDLTSQSLIQQETPQEIDPTLSPPKSQEDKISFDELSLVSMDGALEQNVASGAEEAQHTPPPLPSWNLSSLSLEPLDGEEAPQEEGSWRFDPSKSMPQDVKEEKVEQDLEQAALAPPSLQQQPFQQEEQYQDEIVQEDTQEDSVVRSSVALKSHSDDHAPSLSSIEDLNAWTEQVDTGEDEILGFEPIVIRETAPSTTLESIEEVNLSQSIVDTRKAHSKDNKPAETLNQELLHLELLPPTKTKQEDWKEYFSLLIDYNKSLLDWLDECQKHDDLSPANQKTLINNLMGYQKRESFLLSKALEKMTEVEGMAIRNEIKKMLFPSPPSQDASPSHPQGQDEKENLKPRERLIENPSSASPQPPQVPTRVKQPAVAPVAPVVPEQPSVRPEAPKRVSPPQRSVSDPLTNFKVVQPIKEERFSWWRKFFKKK